MRRDASKATCGRGETETNLEIEIAADQYDKLLAHLNRFIIMDDVDLVALEDETALGSDWGRVPASAMARAGLPALSER